MSLSVPDSGPEPEEDRSSPRVSLSPSRKRSRAVDSDDDTDYSESNSLSPYSLSPCPSPKKWGDSSYATPTMRRRINHATPEDAVPVTPSTNFLKIKIWQRYFGDLSLFDHPCPCCGQLINAKKLNFEIQTIVPLEINEGPVSSATQEWNYFPLCSRDESEGWGCSEKLERYRVEREMEVNEAESPNVHAIDWILKVCPLKLQEIAIRLQIAHGDQFGLSAGESLCLRFIRDVYGTGKASLNSGDRLGDWISENASYQCDILDIADTFSCHTDREMLNIIEMKKKLSTPLSNRKLQSTLSSPAMIMRRSQPSTPFFSPPGKIRMSEKKTTQPDLQEENSPLNEANI